MIVLAYNASMHTMTEKTETDTEPSSSTTDQAWEPHLHLVRQNGNGESDSAATRDTSLFGFLKSLIGGKSEKTLHDALKEFVTDVEGIENQSLDAGERALISNVLSLRGIRAVDVMIPRPDIVAVDSTISVQEIFTLLSEKQFSRFPVYRETLDDVIGTIHIKDIVACLARNEPIEIETLVRDVPIVSPAMHVLDLLLEMKETRRHMALVVDEFGGIDGLVTIGDIIESIVGEIEDEHEIDDEPKLVISPDGTIIAEGRVDIHTFENQFGTFLNDEEREDIDTLGGLVFSIAGRIPNRGEVLSHDSGMVFEILDADPRKVNRLRIKNIPKEPASE